MNNKVAILCEVQGYGTKTHTIDLIAQLIKRGYSVELISCTFKAFDYFPEYIDTSKVTVINTKLSVYNNTFNIKTWRTFLKSIKSRVIILQRSSMYFGTHAFLIACKLTFNKIHYIHHYSEEVAKATSLKERLMRFSKSIYANKIIAVSAFMYEHLIKDWFYPSRKITSVVNGVNINRFKRDTNLADNYRNLHHISKESIVFGVLARLEDDKGVDFTIKAFTNLIKKNPQQSLQLIIIGDGIKRNELEDLAETLGIRSRILFTGFLEDPRPALFCIDFIVASSRKEPFGLSVIEGIAAGCVPIVFAVGGMVEIVTSSNQGWVVPAFDIDKLAMAMNDALQLNKRDRGNMQLNAMQQVNARFDAVKNYEKILNTFNLKSLQGNNN